jgi:multidrug resistance efflux pump
MIMKYVLPMIALAGVGFAVITVVQARQSPPPAVPLVEPPRRPEFRAIAGAGLVEARRENIPIGVNVPGVVTEVFVKKGDLVEKGSPLFRVDGRDLEALLKVREAELAASKAQLAKLRAAPRPEDVPPAEAAVEEAKAKLNDAETAMARTEKLFNRQMAPASDFDRDRFAYHAARAALAHAMADLEKIKRGTWDADLRVAEAAVALSEAQVAATRINLERLTVVAPTDGQVLQLNVRPGQYAAIAWKEPMIVLGEIDKLHVRVDIDENDLPLFQANAEAVATLKGRPGLTFPLIFRFVEPYVIPKQSLTGFNSERVDTRVLQVVYELPDERPIDLYVGQQMDVYLRAAKVPKGIFNDSESQPALPFESESESESETETEPLGTRPKGE